MRTEGVYVLLLFSVLTWVVDSTTTNNRSSLKSNRPSGDHGSSISLKFTLTHKDPFKTSSTESMSSSPTSNQNSPISLRTSQEEPTTTTERSSDSNKSLTPPQEVQIPSISLDIFNGNDMVDNVLVPQEARLQASLDQLASNIADNRKNLDFETVQRNNENNQFQGEVSEHNDAIGAIDESLGLLSYLQHPSLIQVKKIQTNLQSLEKKLNGHSTMGPIVKALLELATESNFANPAAVQEVYYHQ